MKSNPLLELRNMKNEIALEQCDDAKVVLMLAVVVYHCFVFWGGWFTNNPAIPSPAAGFIAEWLGSFHVFAFTVISGYLFYYLQMEKQHYPSFARFICKKIHRLLTPSWAVGLLWVFPLTYLFIPFSFKELVKKYIFLYQPSQLWFLGMLFVCFVLAWFLRNFARNHTFLLGLLCLAAYGKGIVGNHYRLDYFMICTGLMFLPFFELGYKLRQAHSDWLFRFHPVVLLLVDILLFSFLFIIHGQMTGIYKAGYFAFRFLLNLFGAFSAFSILVQWSGRYKWGQMPIFKYLSHRTMIVYLLHQQVIYFFITWLNGAVPPIAHGVINFIGTIIITLALSEVVLRVKVLRYLTGN